MTVDDPQPLAPEPAYDIGELEVLSGVTRRTIRYYIQRGLVPPPSATGRGKHYDQGHLDRLVAVRTRQEAGESLEAIAGGAAAVPAPPVAAPPPEAWLRLTLAPGLELHANAAQLDTVALRQVAQWVREALARTTLAAPLDEAAPHQTPSSPSPRSTPEES